jgi:hypothetical protein
LLPERDLGHYQDQTEADGLCVDLRFAFETHALHQALKRPLSRARLPKKSIGYCTWLSSEVSKLVKRSVSELTLAGGPTGVEYAAELHVSFLKVQWLS